MRPSAYMALGCVLVLACVPGSVHAYMCRQVGVDSNLLVVDGVVYFAQCDGSLTALELQTGRVLLRKRDRGYSGKLRMTEHGILVLGYRNIIMLDRATHAVRWETPARHDPNLCEGHLVSYDRNGLVQCRDLKDGQIRWSYALPGALTVVAEKGRVLLHCAAIFPETGEPVVALLDLKTGRELFVKSPPPGTLYGRAFFDGQRIYLGAGAIRTTPMEAKFERLLVWDLAGKELTATTMPWEPTGEAFYPGHAFSLDGKVFQNGRVRPATPEERATGKVAQERRGPEWHLQADSTAVTIRSFWRRSKEVSTTVEMQSKTGAWRGYVPYLAQWPGGVSQAALAEGKLLLGSSLGHVECIDVATGRSLWIYVFPTMRRTMSYSFPRGMPPRLAEQAAIYRRENRRPDPAGLCLLPSGVPFDEADFAALAPASRPGGGPVVVHDPEPGDPFADLARYLLQAWSPVVLSIVGFSVIFAVAIWRKWNPRWVGVAALVMALPAMFSLYFFGRVSDACTLTGKIVLLVLGACVVYHIYKGVRRRQWRFVVPLLAGLLVLGYYGVLLIRYA